MEKSRENKKIPDFFVNTLIMNIRKKLKWESSGSSVIPMDDYDLILNSFSKDIDDSRYAPSCEFLKFAYDALNDRFFNGELPSLNLEVKSSS